MKFLILILGVAMATDWKPLEDFRKNADESIKKNWLVVVGLEWLQEGKPYSWPELNPVMVFEMKKKKVTVRVLDERDVKIDGKPVKKDKTFSLLSDKSEYKTTIEKGSFQLFIIDRPKGLGVRIKDLQSEALKTFTGIPWWEPKEEYIAKGTWKKLKPVRKIKIPDIQGEITEEKISGYVEFELQGQKLELYPTQEGSKLFFVFKDLTSGKTSYGPGRFLSAELGKDGTVVMDFNRATNPPCAYISFATCPLPPIENYLKISIEAGAKKPTQGH
jgi:uncharacterized protein